MCSTPLVSSWSIKGARAWQTTINQFSSLSSLSNFGLIIITKNRQFILKFEESKWTSLIQTIQCFIYCVNLDPFCKKNVFVLFYRNDLEKFIIYNIISFLCVFLYCPIVLVGQAITVWFMDGILNARWVRSGLTLWGSISCLRGPISPSIMS